MKKYLILICVFVCWNLNAQTTYEKEVAAHRAEINLTFSDAEESILDPDDIAHFQGLEFYPPDQDFKIASKFKKIKNGKIVGFATSTERIANYREYGKLIFRLGGKKCKLIVFEPESIDPEDPDYLFLLFKDLTNGQATYGTGRYLNLSKRDIRERELELDFNYCYNPYCAYSGRYSCPVPPSSNHLKVKIEAGVKTYGKGH